MSYRSIVLFLSVPWLLSPSATALGQKTPDTPKARPTLVASVKSVVPGEPFDLALAFELEKDWHLYWKNPGQAGLPPHVEWDAPPGFVIGELQFPIPRRKTDGAGITSYVLEGSPILLARVIPPAEIETSAVTLTARADWLVCKDLCLREEKSLALSLPVDNPGAAPAPDHQDVFKQAARGLPKTKPTHIKIEASVEGLRNQPKGGFDLVLSIDIPKGLHIQSDKPFLEFLIPADAIPEPAEGILFGEPNFPPGKVREDKMLGGKLSEFEGRITVKVPASLLEGPLKDPLRVAGVFTYQGCTDKGQCYPPETVTFETLLDPARSASAAEGPAGSGRASPESATGQAADSQVQAGAVPPGDAGSQDGPRRRPIDPAPASSEPDDNALTATAAAGGDDANGAPDAAGPAGGVRPAPSSVERKTANGGGGVEGFLKRLGVTGLLIGCFLYGLLLNATPCVFPLLSVKVMGFVHQAHESRQRTLALGLAFGAGVMIFFVILGLLAISGTNLLQFDAFVIGLSALVLAFALSMLGVYTLQAPAAASHLDASIRREGIGASFGKGALAPVLGFACTGPFMVGALGWAAAQPKGIAFLAMMFAGLGMAAPYMLLGANPRWLSFLPRPGAWMIAFERLMGFLLLGLVIYLVHPIGSRYGAAGLEWTFAFLVAVALGCWVLGRVDYGMESAQRWKYRLAAGGVVAAAALLIFGLVSPLSGPGRGSAMLAGGEGNWEAGIPWRPWSEQEVRAQVLAGRTVFVDFTADYCTNCKVNKKVATDTPEARNKMRELGVVPFEADFSHADPVIFAKLKEFDQLGPPLNLIFAPCRPDEPIRLPVTFSQATLLNALDQAGPSRSGGCSEKMALGSMP